MSTYEHPDPIEVRQEQARTLLTAVFGGQTGHLVINTFQPSFSSSSFTASTIERAIQHSIAKSVKQCTYFGTGLRDRAFAAWERGTFADISSIAVVWTEVDYFDPAAHKKGVDKLPIDRQAALKLIEAFALKPSGIIDSGHGFHVYWLLDQPLLITDDASRAAARLLMQQFQNEFNGWARDTYGHHLDTTDDIARVLRVPGTVNWKVASDPKPVRLLSWNDSVSYALDSIPLRVAPGRKASGSKKSTSKGNKGKKNSGATDAQYGPANLDRVTDGCGFFRHCLDDAATLPEPDWHAAATIAVRCTDGRKAFHTLSKPYPAYDQDETDDLLDRAQDAGPMKCATIRAKFGGEPYCSTCPFWSGIATPLVLGRSHDGKPISVSHGDLPELAAKAWAATFEGNVPPVLFRLNQGLARLDVGPDGARVPVVVKVDHMTNRVARAASWVRGTRDGVRGTQPLPAVIRDMLVQPSPPMPLLTGITKVPVFSSRGVLHQTPGYSPDTGRFYDPGGLKVPAVPAHPTPSQLRAAVALFQDELFVDFPFVAASHRAHLMSIVLLPFGRDFITGPTPLHLIDKPIHGTGATLLAKVALMPALGPNVPTRTQPTNEEESRKGITTALLTMSPAVVLDNLSGVINSATLSKVLTDDNWDDRHLGTLTNVSIAVRAVFVATGNNVQLSGELSRRTVPIRLDAKSDRPWQREIEFKHPALQAWATEHRGALVAAALTLWSAWLAEGRPAGDQILGSYEAWSAVIGGVLDVAGIGGFLQNLDSLYERADSEGASQREFVNDWWRNSGVKGKASADLVELAMSAGLPLGPREDLQASTLGTLLKTMEDRQYRVDDEGAEITLTLTSIRRGKKNLWQLVPV
jgi:hypothetical protein